MSKCAWCPWSGNAIFLDAHVIKAHPDKSDAAERDLAEIDGDIKAAEEQAGYPVDRDISDGIDPDDEEADHESP